MQKMKTSEKETKRGQEKPQTKTKKKKRTT